MREDDMIDEMVVELAAANERIRELEAINSSLVDKANSYIVESGQLTNQLAAERKVSDKLEKALEIAIVGACAVGVPHEGERKVLQEAVDVARAVLAEVAALKAKQQQGN